MKRLETGLSIGAKQRVPCKSLELQEGAWNGSINLGFVSVQMGLKALPLDFSILHFTRVYCGSKTWYSSGQMPLFFPTTK